jgi:hypothetical protein
VAEDYLTRQSILAESPFAEKGDNRCGPRQKDTMASHFAVIGAVFRVARWVGRRDLTFSIFGALNLQGIFSYAH